jgi:nucleotidyltransferase/DNA polymerase involved in DNA repair
MKSMAFFKKKGEEEIKDVEDIKDVKAEEPVKEIVKTPKKVEPVRQSETVPLFVKIDKYRNVLSVLNDLKATIFLVKNALTVQRQIEGLVDENRKLIETSLHKIDEKTQVLDLEFTKPRGFEERVFEPSFEEKESLEGVVSDLKKQIDDLRSELKSIA